MVTEGSLLVQSSIATTVLNLTSQPRDEFSTTKRSEGWTEIWGNKSSMSGSSSSTDMNDDECWKIEQEETARYDYELFVSVLCLFLCKISSSHSTSDHFIFQNVTCHIILQAFSNVNNTSVS